MNVNFIAEIRAFHRLKRERPFSANAQALWYELFELFNERRFPDTLAVGTTQLCQIIGVSKDSILRARGELEAAGLLERVGEQRGRQHPTYRMLPVAPEASGGSGRQEGEFAPHGGLRSGTGAGGYANFCGAQEDATGNSARGCDAQEDTSCDAKTGEEFCVAGQDATCDAKAHARAFATQVASSTATLIYTNNKPGYGNQNGVTQKNGVCITYNDAWRRSARARAATAQKIIDVFEGEKDDEALHGQIVRFLEMKMEPGAIVDAMMGAYDSGQAAEQISAAAARMGIYAQMERETGIPAQIWQDARGDPEAAEQAYTAYRAWRDREARISRKPAEDRR